MHKHAFEGNLTAKWREENRDKLELPAQLLARVRQEREACYQQQLADWKATVKAWETSGKEGVRPGKPKASGNLMPLADKELPKLPNGWYWAPLSWLLSIGKKAFSGQLVSQDPGDEPASVLLERIKAERAIQAPKKTPHGRKVRRNVIPAKAGIQKEKRA